MKWHDKVAFKRRIFKTLKNINEDELNYLEKKEITFKNGVEFLPKSHDYAFDLDFFGENSIFQNINRTATFKGKNTLANLLMSLKSKEEIIQNQEAIRELASKITFRQDVLALAKITADSEEVYTNLIKWSKTINPYAKILTIASFVMPLIFIGLFILSQVEDNTIFSKLLFMIFLLNLGIFGSLFSKIKGEILNFHKINEIIRNYGLIINHIETENFTAPKLKNLQRQLTFDNIKASKQIQNLSSLFKQIEGIINPIAAVIINGTILYHLHAYRFLIRWKKAYATQISLWLDIIGEFEALNSLANLSYNNPAFCFPEINEEYKIDFKELGHPLIKENGRVNNTVNFNTENFIILTGSNMAGKSTFLRSLGVNMVLAGVGSVVCAKEATVHPLKVLVSMRLSDSLEENESYFFAEVKRLKEIMNKLDKEVSFVLLDEILRGTNSDDKRSGTIEVIKKMIAKKAIGAIATHDLEVCKTTEEFPKILSNKNFEVEIVKNELVFDYKLREGICKNKSATFLMKKMGVI
tara:strand:+ start:17 stop:1591 length:1575 start_codon:yes stop_codon:yes gene_type:complete